MGYLEVDGNRLECKRISADSPGPTIVFLHHGLGCVSTWRDFPEKLCAATNLPGFVYSRAGYGRSSPIELPRKSTYLRDGAEQDLPKVIRAAGLKDLILLGHSDGATMSLIQAGERPAGLQAVIVMAPHMFVEQRNLDAITETRRNYVSTDLRAKLERHHGGNVDGAFFGWADAWLMPEFGQLEISKDVASITCPTLGIRGTRDEYGSPKQIERLRDSATCPLQILEPDCGHFPHQENEADTLDAIVSFLDEARR